MTDQPDIRQWAYGAWWTRPTDTDNPQRLDPQPPPPTTEQLQALDDGYDAFMLQTQEGEQR